MLISPEYVALNATLHRTTPSYGCGGGSAANLVRVCEQLGTRDVLDYGCGKGTFGARMPWPIKEYDPAIPGKQGPAEPADIVICRDVLEHVEPECLDAVLADLARCVKTIGLLTIATGPSWDVLPDGRNAHLLQRPAAWWRPRLSEYFRVAGMDERSQITAGGSHQLFIGGTELAVAVTPKDGPTWEVTYDE